MRLTTAFAISWRHALALTDVRGGFGKGWLWLEHAFRPDVNRRRSATGTAVLWAGGENMQGAFNEFRGVAEGRRPGRRSAPLPARFPRAPGGAASPASSSASIAGPPRPSPRGRIGCGSAPRTLSVSWYQTAPPRSARQRLPSIMLPSAPSYSIALRRLAFNVGFFFLW